MNPSEETITPRGRGRGEWRPLHDRKELRRPRTEEKIGCAGKSNNEEDPGAGGDIKKTGSTLSAAAKEFYPKGYHAQQTQICYNSQFVEPLPEGGDQHSTAVQSARNHIMEMMEHLTLNPGRFDSLIAPLVDTFRLWLQQEDTMAALIDVIVEQSISEPNLRYNGARLCSFLNHEFPSGEFSFKSALLKRCQKEHLQRDKYLFYSPLHLHGYIMFIAELFMQLEATTQGCNARIMVLGTAILEVLSELLSLPTPENIKCICNVLKLTGLLLDAQDSTGMDPIIQNLTLLYNNTSLEANIRRLIYSVVQLRQQGWGEASSLAPKSITPQYNASLQNEPVFYGPDGQIMTAEESKFLQESVGKITDSEEYDEYSEDGEAWVPDDEMDEEIQAAYEQFLKMGLNSKQCSD